MNNEPLDIHQVLELIHNGFTREGACFAVAESHEQGIDYAEAMLAHPEVAACDDGFDEEEDGFDEEEDSG